VTWLGPETVVTADDAVVVERSWHEPMCFGILFDRHAPSIYRYIARRVGRGAIDDLVAETFIGAFSSRLRYNLTYRDARPWLYGIATHVIGGHRREELHQLRISQAVWSARTVPGHTDRVAADITAQSLSEPLGAALSALAAGDRDVLILIAWEQLTYEEVARALEIPIGTVRSRLHRARASVQEALASLGTLATVVEVLHND